MRVRRSGGGPNFASTAHDPRFHHATSKFGYAYWLDAFQMLTAHALRPLHVRHWSAPNPPPPATTKVTGADPHLHAAVKDFAYSTAEVSAEVAAHAQSDRSAGRTYNVCFSGRVSIGVSSYNPKVIPAPEVVELIALIKRQAKAQFVEWQEQERRKALAAAAAAAALAAAAAAAGSSSALVTGDSAASSTGSAAPVATDPPFTLPLASYTLSPAGPHRVRVGIIARTGRRRITNELELVSALHAEWGNGNVAGGSDSVGLEVVLVRFEKMPYYQQVSGAAGYE